MLDNALLRRAELLESARSLEAALAEPGAAPDWVARVADRLVDLSQDLDAHVRGAEGPDGTYAEVLRTAPRLARAVERLRRDHIELAAEIATLYDLVSAHPDMTRVPAGRDGLLAHPGGPRGAVRDGGGGALVADAPVAEHDPFWIERVRTQGTELLGRLVRHRQRGADLLFHAFTEELGGQG